MIAIEIDLVPFGVLEPKRLKSIKIWNDGTGDHYTGNYKYEIKAGNGNVYRRGTIQGFKRRSNDVLKLLGIILKQEGYIT